MCGSLNCCPAIFGWNVDRVIVSNSWYLELDLDVCVRTRHWRPVYVGSTRATEAKEGKVAICGSMGNTCHVVMSLLQDQCKSIRIVTFLNMNIA